MDLLFIISGITALVILGLGFLVYSRNKKKKINQYFLFITFSVVIWIGGVMGLSFLHELPKQQALILGRIPFLGAILLSGLLFYFSQIFPQRTVLVSNLANLLAFTFCGIFIFLSLFTDLILRDIIFRDTFPIAVFGPLISLFGLIFLALSLSSIAILALKYKNLRRLERRQIFYFFIGLTLSIIGGSLTNLILPQFKLVVHLYQYGPLTVVFFIIFTTFAITRYRLFEIRVILTELLVGLMGIILVILPFVMPTSSLKILTGAVFILFCIFGYYLIKATHEESKRREEAEKIAVQERALRGRAEKLAREFERLDRAKTQFILATQHHLRTPLSIVKGYSSMLLEGSYGKLEEKTKRVVSGINEAIEKLIKLVNEFLDISQLQVGREILKKEETQIEKLIEEIIEELNPSAKEKGIYLKLEVEEGLPKIKLDRTKIKSAIFNVIDNGIKYTPKGGVTINLKSQNSNLKIAVKDTGIGLTKEEIKTLFTEFFERGKEAEKIYTTGRGIGLYVAKNIIEAHRGKIWGESEGKGKGSTFYIELPLE